MSDEIISALISLDKNSDPDILHPYSVKKPEQRAGVNAHQVKRLVGCFLCYEYPSVVEHLEILYH